MQCMVCGGEMRVERIVRDESMAVSGFEHRTLMCVGCGESEERLVFAQDRSLARGEASLSDQIEDPTPVLFAEKTVVAEGGIVGETACEPMSAAMSEPVPETELASEPSTPAQLVIRPAATAPPPGAWALAIERIRTHQTVLAQRAATLSGAADALPPAKAEEPLLSELSTPSSEVVRPAPAWTAPSLAPATPASELDDFDRLWESLGRPSPEPAAIDVAPVTPETRTIDPAPPAAPPPVLLPVGEAPPETPTVVTVSAPAATASRPPEPVPTAEPKEPQDVFPNALSRAVALLRGHRPHRNDTILRIDGQDIPQISEEALRLTPRDRVARWA